MKHKKTFIAITVLIATLSFPAVAQNKKEIKDQNFWYMMKNSDGTGDEITDVLRFTNNVLISERAGNQQVGQRVKISRPKDKQASEISGRIEASNGEVLLYDCIMENGVIYGSVDMINTDGSVRQMVMRGMHLDRYMQIKKAKEDYSRNIR